VKIKFKFKRRYNVYYTCIACATGLWLLYAKFGLSLNSLLLTGLISILLLIIVIAIAAGLAVLIRKIMDLKDN